ncbi:MAG: hypothetical protein ABII21_03665 [bacterium]
MTTQNPTNQDILNAISGLTKTVNQNSTDLTSLSGIVSKIAIDVTELKSDVAVLKSEMSEVKDEQERQGKKLDQLAGSASFSPGISGAFAA